MVWRWKQKKIMNDHEYTMELIDVSDRYQFSVSTYAYDIYVPELRAIVGQCEYREETDPLDLEYYGQIGYLIFFPYRGHHFAYYACLKLMDLLKEKGITECIITCNPDNEASRKTILRLGGEYLRQVDVSRKHPLYKIEKQKLVFHLSW